MHVDHKDLPESWTVRAYQRGDERALVELFREVFRRTMSEEQWRWKLKTLPSPVENVGIAVNAGDHPVFQIAGVPCTLRLGGVERPAMVAVDAMTAPEFRRRGILTGVTRELFHRWHEAGIALVLGLPNEQWGSRTRALGWQALFPLRWFIRPLRPEALLARRLNRPELARVEVLGRMWNRWFDRRVRRVRDVTVRELAAPGPEIDEAWRACRDSIGASLVHDTSWVAWRYFAAPHHDYRVLVAERRGRVLGYAVYHLRPGGGRSFGFIPDVLAPRRDEETAYALLGEALARLVAGGAEGAATLAPPGSPLDRILRRAGFVFSWGAFRVECVPLDPMLPMDALRRPDVWHLAGGDFDVV